MAILWARYKSSVVSDIDDKGQQSFHEEYTVKCDTPTENRTAILQSGIIPAYGSPHPQNQNAVCVRVAVNQNKDAPRFWDVSADWKANPRSKRDPKDDQKQPDQRRPKWSCKFVEIPASRFFDLAGKPLASTAGQPFDPVPDIPIIADEITITQYEAVCDRGKQRKYMDHCNGSKWFGAAPGTAFMADISVQDEYLQGAYWFPTTYRILIKPRIIIELPKGKMQEIGGWDPEYVCNLGTLEFDEVAGGVFPILRKDPVSGKPFYDGRPAYLDADGLELARDSSGIYTADPIFLEFKFKARIDFNDLHLDPPEGMTGE